MSVNEFVDPVLGRIVAAKATHGCSGCLYDDGDYCHRPAFAPACWAGNSADSRETIWVHVEEPTGVPCMPLPDADATDWKAEAERLRGLLSHEQQERHAALAEVERITEAGRAHIRRAAAFEAQRDELAARLAQIEAQETVAWLETDKRGGRMLFCHDSPYPNSVDEYFCVVKTELIARPAPSAAPERAEPTDAELVAAEWPDGFEQAAQSLPTLADAAALFDEQAQAEPGHLEDATMSAAPEQLASRPACDWPGKCKHQRPSPAAAPERAEPIGACGDACIRDSDAASESFEALRDMIAAKLEDARRDGAEAMLEKAEALIKKLAPPGWQTSTDAYAQARLASEFCDNLRALPLPTGGRQAVLLTDEQVDEIEAEHWSGPGLGASFNREAFARAIEAAVLKANGLGDQQ